MSLSLYFSSPASWCHLFVRKLRAQNTICPALSQSFAALRSVGGQLFNLLFIYYILYDSRDCIVVYSCIHSFRFCSFLSYSSIPLRKTPCCWRSRHASVLSVCFTPFVCVFSLHPVCCAMCIICCRFCRNCFGLSLLVVSPVWFLCFSSSTRHVMFVLFTLTGPFMRTEWTVFCVVHTSRDRSDTLASHSVCADLWHTENRASNMTLAAEATPCASWNCVFPQSSLPIGHVPARHDRPRSPTRAPSVDNAAGFPCKSRAPFRTASLRPGRRSGRVRCDRLEFLNLLHYDFSFLPSPGSRVAGFADETHMRMRPKGKRRGGDAVPLADLLILFMNY